MGSTHTGNGDMRAAQGTCTHISVRAPTRQEKRKTSADTQTQTCVRRDAPKTRVLIDTDCPVARSDRDVFAARAHHHVCVHRRPQHNTDGYTHARTAAEPRSTALHARYYIPAVRVHSTGAL